jgi:hypothetical protein
VHRPFVPPTHWKPTPPARGAVSRAVTASVTEIFNASAQVASPAATAVIEGLGSCSWRFVDDTRGMVLTLNRSNELELWDGTAWLPADSIVNRCLAGSTRTLNLLPQSGVAADAHAGDTSVTVTDLEDFAPGSSMEWFTPGQTLLIDPGGEFEEQAMVVGVDGAVLTLAGPLAHDHAVSALVAAITTSEGELPSTGGGGSWLPIVGGLLVLFGLICAGLGRPRKAVAR